MATELAIAMRKLKAQEAQTREIAELNRKMDLVMAALSIKDPAKVEEVPATDETKAEEPSATDETKTDEVPAGDETAASVETPDDTGKAKAKKK